MKERLTSLSLSIVLIFSLVGCAGKPAAYKPSTIANPTTTLASTPTTQPTPMPTPVPAYKGEFRDMTAQQFIEEIGPGYTNTSLSHYDPFIGYDPYPSIPVYLNVGFSVQDHNEYAYYKMIQLVRGKPVEFFIDLKGLPDTPDDLRYNQLNSDAGVRSWQDVPITIKIENARIEFPTQTLDLAQANGTFMVTARERYNPSQDWIWAALIEGSLLLEDMPNTSTLRNGTYKADITLIESVGPDKADYYSDKGLREYEPELTSEWFRFLKSEGYNSIRFQITWFNHTNDETYEIDQAWLNKVEDYIKLALENDLYVSINLQWDMARDYSPGMNEEQIVALANRHGWLTLDGNPQTEERFAAVWTQIAEYFKDYDEHLIFESMNEPMSPDDTMDSLGSMDDPNSVGWLSIGGVGDNLNRLNQIFVDSVRATGGNNAKRFLIVPPFFTKGRYLPAFKLPEDPTEHLVVGINYYLGDYRVGGGDPFPNIQKYLLDNNIPAIMTEFGSTSEEFSYEERVAFTKEAVTKAKTMGIPIIWYAGGWAAHGNDSPDFCLYNPFTYEKPFPELIDILMGKSQ